jgi:hypothetical protein
MSTLLNLGLHRLVAPHQGNAALPTRATRGNDGTSTVAAKPALRRNAYEPPFLIACSAVLRPRTRPLRGATFAFIPWEVKVRAPPLPPGIARAHPDRVSGEVHVAPAEREQLAAPPTRERSREEDGRVLLAFGRAHERPHLLEVEHLDVAGASLWIALDADHRVRRQLPDALRAAEDPVQGD